MAGDGSKKGGRGGTGDAGTPPADLAAIARRYALQNAVQYGQADAKSTMGKVMGEHAALRSRAKELMAALEAAVADVNAMAPDEQKAALEAEAPELLARKVKERRTGLKPLPDAQKGKVVMRFAPNPNGPLSLGHSRGVAVLAAYAEEYDAELILRYDDTDPQVKPPLLDDEHGWDGYAMCLEDFAWLAGRTPDRTVRASDRLDVYYKAARELIGKGGAYVCTCEADAFRAMKAEGHPCPHRDIGADALQKAFQKMVAGGYEAGGAVLRVKTDIGHKDPALRDWVAFRIVAAGAVHPRAARGLIDDHRCWPLLDFESAVEDHEQGVTHIIRGKDLMDSTRKQKFLYDHMGWTYPTTLYWGRVSIHGVGKFSTSAMRRAIEAGDFEGWDDPRLPTLAALRRRGFRPDALRRFWVSLGLTEKDVAVSMANIEAENAKDVDDDAPRFFFVPDPRPLSVRDIAGRVAEPLVQPSFPDRGRRRIEAAETIVVPGDEMQHKQVRLKDLGNILIAGGSAFWTGDAMDRSVPIVQWLPKAAGRPFTVLRPGTVAEDAPEGAVAPLHRVEGLVEPAVLEHVGDVVQFERYGFVRIESETQGVWLHA